MQASAFCVYLLFVKTVAIAEPNLALNKPCIQSGTYSDIDGTHNCSWAVDGSTTTVSSSTKMQDEPYWQVDLQGYYIVSHIRVSSDSDNWSVSINNAKIAITSYDIVCNRNRIIVCGQWPCTDHRDQTLVFTCTDIKPVRYIRIWREQAGFLVIREVEVRGQPGKTLGMKFERTSSGKLSTPVSIFSVSYKADCTIACYESQPCLAFSHSASQSPNCILATDLAITPDEVWDTFHVKDCFKMDVC